MARGAAPRAGLVQHPVLRLDLLTLPTNHHHLKPLSVDEAIELLRKIAQLNSDTELEAYLGTPRGRARIHAIHHLAGGNHRLFIVLSELLSKEPLDQLVQPFEKMVDEQLTPYYQERLRWLSPLQRRIVELLCQVGQPIPVKQIAERLFVAHTTATPQLKQLREMGYVVSTQRGREALYELAEPLMRLSMQVKETGRAEPLGVIVDFLRVWYDREELAGRVEEALADYTSASESAEASSTRLQALRLRAEGCAHLGKTAEAIEDLRRVIEDPEATEGDVAAALTLRGELRATANSAEAALADLTRALGLAALSAEDRARAFTARAYSLAREGRIDEAIRDYEQAAELPQGSAPWSTMAKYMLTILHLGADRLQDAVRWLASALGDDVEKDSILPILTETVLWTPFLHFGSPEVWRPRVAEIVTLYARHGVLSFLGNALVSQLSRLQTSSLAPDVFRQWLTAWQAAAADQPALALPLRLLRAGIDYLTGEPRDQGVLLQLPSEERALVRQALGLPP